MANTLPNTIIRNALNNATSSTPLHPSHLIHCASPHIVSILASLGGSHAVNNDADSAFSPYSRTQHNNGQTISHRVESSFPPSPPTTKLLAESSPLKSLSIKPLISPEEMQAWQTPHMPLLTPKQLELTLLEIRRRHRHRLSRQKQNQQPPIIERASQASNEQPSNNDQQQKSAKREAAILVPLCTVQGIPSVLFTRRSAQLSTHASQISFPGGYYDEALDDGNNVEILERNGLNVDYKLVNTASREMQEELCYNIKGSGINGHFEYFNRSESGRKNEPTPKQQQMQQTQKHESSISQIISTKPLLTILGQTQPVPSMTGSKVTPIIAIINYDLPPHNTDDFTALFPGNPDEVDWIFTIPIQELISKETSEPLTRWSKGDGANVKGKHEYWGPVFPIPNGNRKRKDDKVWGLTASVLRPLLHKVFVPVLGEMGMGVVKSNYGGVSNCSAAAKL